MPNKTVLLLLTALLLAACTKVEYEYVDIKVHRIGKVGVKADLYRQAIALYATPAGQATSQIGALCRSIVQERREPELIKELEIDGKTTELFVYRQKSGFDYLLIQTPKSSPILLSSKKVLLNGKYQSQEVEFKGMSFCSGTISAAEFDTLGTRQPLFADKACHGAIQLPGEAESNEFLSLLVSAYPGQTFRFE